MYEKKKQRQHNASNKLNLKVIIVKRYVFGLGLNRLTLSHEHILLVSLFQSSGAEKEKALDS